MNTSPNLHISTDLMVLPPDVKQPEYVEWWITITRDHGLPDLVVGPYSTEALAVSAMNESLLIQGFVEENCLECEVTPKEVVLIDQDDPDHFGTVKP